MGIRKEAEEVALSLGAASEGQQHSTELTQAGWQHLQPVLA